MHMADGPHRPGEQKRVLRTLDRLASMKAAVMPSPAIWKRRSLARRMRLAFLARSIQSPDSTTRRLYIDWPAAAAGS